MKLKRKCVQKSEKEKSHYSVLSNLLFMVKHAWRVRKIVLPLCVLPAIVMVGLNLLELYIAPIILQKVESAVPVSELLGVILLLTVGLIGLHVLSAYLEMPAMVSRVYVRLGIGELVNEKVAKMSFPLLEDAEVTKKLAKANDVLMGNSASGEAIWVTLTDVQKNVLGFLIYLLILSKLPILLTVVVLITSLLGYIISRHYGKWEYQNRQEAAQYERELGYIHEKLEEKSFAKDLRIFGAMAWLEEMYQKSMRLYEDFFKRREAKHLRADIADVLLTFVRNGVAYMYLISQTISGELSAAEFLLYFSAVSGFTVWVKGNLDTFIRLHKQSLELSSLREFLDYPEVFLFEEGEKIDVLPDRDYKLSLVNVSFRYPGADKDTISHMNLTLKPGEKVAIVGANGAGKTTLIKLLCGFYDPTEGEVLLNGENIKKYNRRDYYRLFTAVFQQYSTLNVTLAENVATSVEEVDLEKVKECVEISGLTEVVAALPNGAQTPIGREVLMEGTELSGGQMQRLMLARALYKNAPIIVLDEPTAALDPLAEADLYRRYHELTQGRTSVYISHRLASTRFCDRVLYMEDGQILEEGTHETLLLQKGKYANMFDIQSRYYQEGRAF